MSTPAPFACALVLSKAFENRLKQAWGGMRELSVSWVSALKQLPLWVQRRGCTHRAALCRASLWHTPESALRCRAGPLSSLHVWESLQPLKSISACFRATCTSDWSDCTCMAQECTLGAVGATGAGSGKCWAWGWKLCFPALDLTQIFLCGFRQARWPCWLSICTALFPRR